MSKKKNSSATNAIDSTEEITPVTVEETPDEGGVTTDIPTETTEDTEETPVTESKTPEETETSTVEEATVSEPVETSTETEDSVVEEPEVQASETAEETEPETPVTESETPEETETPTVEEAVKEVTPKTETERERLDREMLRQINYRYCLSPNSKRFATRFTGTISDLYGRFAKNYTSFFACCTINEYNNIAELFTYKVRYNGIELSKDAKLQFLTKLKINTLYAVARWKEK